jgi:hypothetical protein
VWIRDVVHVIRHADGAVDCLVGFMFAISERKRAEDKILQLQKELEALSYGEPLSLVMVDIEYCPMRHPGRGHGHVQHGRGDDRAGEPGPAGRAR